MGKRDRINAPDRALPLAEVAKRLGCSIITVRRRIRDKELPAIKTGRLVRVLERDLLSYVRRSRFNPTQPGGRAQ